MHAYMLQVLVLQNIEMFEPYIYTHMILIYIYIYIYREREREREGERGAPNSSTPLKSSAKRESTLESPIEQVEKTLVNP